MGVKGSTGIGIVDLGVAKSMLVSGRRGDLTTSTNRGSSLRVRSRTVNATIGVRLSAVTPYRGMEGNYSASREQKHVQPVLTPIYQPPVEKDVAIYSLRLLWFRGKPCV